MGKAKLHAVPTRMTLRERQELQQAWPGLECPHCGNAHPGDSCPRIREYTRTRAANGATSEHVIYWGEGEWSPREGTRTYADVFGFDAAPLPRRQPEPPPQRPTSLIDAVAKVKKPKKGAAL